ncbi:MAG TPA: 2-polyprenyl-3-methyl-6-methoxy-1,4-benzoquinone monooxygenase [Burkholderiales bacterium]|nr:2-polyprenyl-3-methyl-6-methoxy-1,4-benzoquinone monooxygenase [Burkholderiales bacterium]
MNQTNRAERTPRRPPSADRVIAALDGALRTLFAPAHSTRPIPGEAVPDSALDEHQRQLSCRLMRVNHSGEVCAQALYQGQIAVARDSRVRGLLESAAREEIEHLAWTQRRLDELGASRSLLAPIWYAGSFTIGAVSGLLGDRWNLGFLAETERQVEAHLDSHLGRLPPQDRRSRAIVEQMKRDEARHAVNARRQGAADLPGIIKFAMWLGAKAMTGTSHWL